MWTARLEQEAAAMRKRWWHRRTRAAGSPCVCEHAWMALPTCTLCYGTGVELLRGRVCSCVYRAIFRQCLTYYRNRQPSTSTVAEWRADFILTAARALDSEQFRVLRQHLVAQRPWFAFVPASERGNFYHRLYVLEARLGHAFAYGRPYALWPIHEYFSSSRRPLHGYVLCPTAHAA